MALKEVIKQSIETCGGNKIQIPMTWLFHRDKYFESDGKGDFVPKTTRVNDLEIPLFTLSPQLHNWKLILEVDEIPENVDFEEFVFNLIATYKQDKRPFNVIFQEWKDDPNVKRVK